MSTGLAAERAPVTDALLTLLRSLWPDRGQGHRVGDANRPDDTSGPYAILYPIPGGSFGLGPPLSAPDADAAFVYQVTVAGRTRRQAERLADRLREGMIGRVNRSFVRRLDVAGHDVMMRAHDGSPGGAEREGSLWTVADRYAIWVTRRG